MGWKEDIDEERKELLDKREKKLEIHEWQLNNEIRKREKKEANKSEVQKERKQINIKSKRFNRIEKKVDKLTVPTISNPFKPKQSIKQVVSNINQRRLNAERLAVQSVNSVPENKHLFFKQELDNERAKHIKWLGS